MHTDLIHTVDEELRSVEILPSRHVRRHVTRLISQTGEVRSTLKVLFMHVTFHCVSDTRPAPRRVGRRVGDLEGRRSSPRHGRLDVAVVGEDAFRVVILFLHHDATGLHSAGAHRRRCCTDKLSDFSNYY